MNYYKSAFLVLFFSSFLYLEYFNFQFLLLNTIISLGAILLLLKASKKELFLSGTFIGILWFWWIGYSFIYYSLFYLAPLAVLAIASVYGTLFFIGGFFQNIYLKSLYFFLFTFIEPFGFNWFKPELLFINSYLGIEKIEFFIVLFISAYFLQNYTQKKHPFFIYTSTILLLISFNLFKTYKTDKIDLHIKQYNTHIKQEEKWKKENRSKIVQENLHAIESAIKQNYDLIILPETAFPLILNYDTILLKQLKYYSNKIAIITGALHKKNNQLHNSTYLFDKGNLQIAHKVVLVPFGEAVPFPEMIRNWINNTFYNGASDYIVANTPTTFDIKGYKFRNAICYEATTDKIYKNLDTQHIIAISNNAWFVPSPQPTLQKLLMKYYEKKYNVKIISITNQ
jgi:apolipoprotein N-acyltransferase